MPYRRSHRRPLGRYRPWPPQPFPPGRVRPQRRRDPPGSGFGFVNPDAAPPAQQSPWRARRADDPGYRTDIRICSAAAGHLPRGDIVNRMDSRASDKIPGARVRVKRRPPAQTSSGARPREWLALPDGTVQEARTEGPALALIGRPLPYEPGRAERRSGVPAEIITADHVPNSCTCSWAYSQGKLTLKHYNAACPVHPDR